MAPDNPAQTFGPSGAEARRITRAQPRVPPDRTPQARPPSQAEGHRLNVTGMACPPSRQVPDTLSGPT